MLIVVVIAIAVDYVITEVAINVVAAVDTNVVSITIAGSATIAYILALAILVFSGRLFP